jgi:starch phosphorylase
VGRSRLILVDTNVSGNTPEVQALTAQLYGGGNKVRIRQELVLGVGGLRILNAMGIDPGVIHMNEGHSAFATLEITRQLMERDGQSFGNMREKAAAMCVFTTHTPVEAGHDRFEADMVEQTLGPLRQQLGISEAELMAFGRVFPEEPTEKFCMTVLGLKMSRIRNAVSNLHAHLSRAMWRSLWPTREEHEIPIAHITNGVHTGTWLAPEISSFYRRCLGDGWLNRIDDPMTWAAAEGFSDDEFWELKQILKARLITFVRRRVRRQNEARGEAPDKACEGKTLLDPAVLTIGCARRFAQYKRADLLLRDLKRLNQLVNNADRPVQIVYAGKAHPEDEWSKGLLEKVYEVTRDPRFCTRIVFVEDYDIDVARHLVQGVDVWLNNPRRPLEACGTSGQKAVLNGTLNLSVLDGWWAEAYDGTNGFAIGKGSEHSQWDYQDQLDMEMLYKILNEQVVPMFYSRDADGIPKEWTARQKNALRTLAWRFSAQRMVKEYAVNCYLPAAGAVTCSMPACSMSYR